MEIVMKKNLFKLGKINVRTEFHGSEEVAVGVDIGVSMTVDAEFLDQLVTAPKGFAAFLGIGTDKPSHGIEAFKFAFDYDDMIIDLNYSVDEKAGRRFQNVKLKNFVASPDMQKNEIGLTFQIQLTPTDDEMHWLTDGITIQHWEIAVIGVNQRELIEDAA